MVTHYAEPHSAFGVSARALAEAQVPLFSRFDFVEGSDTSF
jgi:hypothetical protein